MFMTEKESKIQAHLDQGKNYLVNRLKSKATLKLDVYENTQKWFKQFKIELENCVETIAAELNDPRIRLKFVNKNDHEAQLFIGSDVLVFNMHTNVFKLQPNEYANHTSYVRNNPSNAFCGIIRVYNFLADSYEFNRLYDVGYLIGRVFVNSEDHFMIEGKGQLGFIYRDFMHQVLTPDIIKDIILRLAIHSIEFDLFTPPYKVVQKTTVNDLNELAHSSKMKTGKRLGFKFESEQNIM